jgi:hypothetical protein
MMSPSDIALIQKHGQRLLREAASRDDDWCRVPDEGLRDLENYVAHRIEPGGFLFAVLTNNLLVAVERADETNLRLLPQWVRLLDNYVPTECWGSDDRVEAWLQCEEEHDA